jgi:hypothetical protein
MNCRPTGSLSLTKASTGFFQYKAAEGLSPNTLQSHQRDLKLWLEHEVGRFMRAYQSLTTDFGKRKLAEELKTSEHVLLVRIAQ